MIQSYQFGVARFDFDDPEKSSRGTRRPLRNYVAQSRGTENQVGALENQVGALKNQVGALPEEVGAPRKRQRSGGPDGLRQNPWR